MRKFRSLNGAKVYKAWKEWVEGDYVIGKYTGSSIDNYKKNSWHIHVEESQFEDGTDLNEKTVGLNSTGLLDKVMEGVVVGEVIKVEYCGMHELTSGPYEGTKSHSLVVSVLDDEEEQFTNDDDGL